MEIHALRVRSMSEMPDDVVFEPNDDGSWDIVCRSEVIPRRVIMIINDGLQDPSELRPALRIRKAGP